MLGILTFISMINTTFERLKTREGAQWLNGRVLDSRARGQGFEPHRLHCVVSLSKNINPSLVLVQPRKTHPFITERLLMERKESNQTKTNKTLNKKLLYLLVSFFMSSWNFVLSGVEHEKSFLMSGPGLQIWKHYYILFLKDICCSIRVLYRLQ